jgi:hypothetical protein
MKAKHALIHDTFTLERRYQRWLGKFGQKSFWDKWKDLLID